MNIFTVGIDMNESKVYHAKSVANVLEDKSIQIQINSLKYGRSIIPVLWSEEACSFMS